MTGSKKLVLGGHEKVKIAIAQISPAYLDREASIKRAVGAIAEAAAHGAAIVVFPEVWLSGYPYWTEGWDSHLPNWVQGRVAFRDAALLVPSDETEALAAAARGHRVIVVMGCNEIDERPECSTIYNSLLFFDRDGTLLGRHRKLMPTFGERQFWGMGDGSDIRVFQTDFGRIGGLICGEHLMTLARAAMIAEGEDIHIAAFPGAFALHTGPRLEELDTTGAFWGHASVRAHALEAGAFVISACGYLDAADVADDFPYKATMNISYAQGGSSVIAPLGIPLVEPSFGNAILYADLEAWMIKAWRAIIDTVGHYARPDVFQLLIRQGDWRIAGTAKGNNLAMALRDRLMRSAEVADVDVGEVQRLLTAKTGSIAARDL